MSTGSFTPLSLLVVPPILEKAAGGEDSVDGDIGQKKESMGGGGQSGRGPGASKKRKVSFSLEDGTA